MAQREESVISYPSPLTLKRKGWPVRQFKSAEQFEAVGGATKKPRRVRGMKARWIVSAVPGEYRNDEAVNATMAVQRYWENFYLGNGWTVLVWDKWFRVGWAFDRVGPAWFVDRRWAGDHESQTLERWPTDPETLYIYSPKGNPPIWPFVDKATFENEGGVTAFPNQTDPKARFVVAPIAAIYPGGATGVKNAVEAVDSFLQLFLEGWGQGWEIFVWDRDDRIGWEYFTIYPGWLDALEFETFGYIQEAKGPLE